MEEIVTFKNFIFDCNSGELIQTITKREKKVNRLSPQSAKLLQLLILNYPELVSKDEIRRLLWPNVKVDFDNSLHFCIRQIRVALEDDASNPKYIETIPRRGYRWLVKIGAPKKKTNTIQWVLAIFLLILSSISMNYFLFSYNQKGALEASQKHTNIRLVIMPLQPPDSSNLFYGNMIAYKLLGMLGNMNDLEIIGPTTTQNVNQENLYNFFEETEADYIINGKFSHSELESSVLVEIIRASDKAHIWVATFNYDSSPEHITREIYNEFIKQINLSR
jgi:DNA-binding winged helix-turn-helix (wHTH) protein/TolB-like protein